MNPNNFGIPLIFAVVPPAGQTFYPPYKFIQNLCTGIHGTQQMIPTNFSDPVFSSFLYWFKYVVYCDLSLQDWYDIWYTDSTVAPIHKHVSSVILSMLA